MSQLCAYRSDELPLNKYPSIGGRSCQGKCILDPIKSLLEINQQSKCNMVYAGQEQLDAMHLTAGLLMQPSAPELAQVSAIVLPMVAKVLALKGLQWTADISFELAKPSSTTTNTFSYGCDVSSEQCVSQIQHGASQSAGQMSA